MGFQVISSGVGIVDAGGIAFPTPPNIQFQAAKGTAVEILSITFCNTSTDTTRTFNLGFSPDGGGAGTWIEIVKQKSLAAKETWIWGTGGGAIMALGPNDVLGLDPGENIHVTVFGREVR